MVDFERFNKLNDLCNKSRLPISSIKETERLAGEDQDIISNPGTEPFEDAEKVLISVIDENLLLGIIGFITRVDAENIKLSDEELKLLEEKKDSWEGGIGWIEKSTKELEESSSDLLREVATRRKKDKLMEKLRSAKGLFSRVIEKEKTRRQNPSNGNGGNNNNGGGDNSGNGNGNNNSDDTKKKITNLQNQINTLEEKLRKQPDSDSNSEDKEKLARLKAEIEELKRKQKDKPQNENQGTKKDNFPYGLVIGGGVVIFLLLIAVIFFWQRSKRK